MSSYSFPPPQGEWKKWAVGFQNHLSKILGKLRYLTVGETAAEDGVMMWDREDQHPVVSVSGEFMPLAYGENCAAMFYDTTNQTPAAINTPYPISFDSSAYLHQISLGTGSPVPTTGILFEQSGRFRLAFSVQLSSTSSSTKDTWFWPRINGVDVPGFTMRIGFHSQVTQVTTRSVVMEIDAGDYMEAMWAADDTNIQLSAYAATAFCPATPSVILSISEIGHLPE